jgi:hypothetical protein
MFNLDYQTPKFFQNKQNVRKQEICATMFKNENFGLQVNLTVIALPRSSDINHCYTDVYMALFRDFKTNY